MPTHIFPKSQRIKSRKKLQQVFAEGKSVRTKDLRLVYLAEKNETGDVKCGVGLTTRNFKHAVDRNRIKRLLREAYRLQQHDLKSQVANNHPINLSLFLLYTGREMPLYQHIYENVGVVLQKLQKALHAAVPENT
ncbi:ribonuclease P protein component [Niabella hibiscisoli]|uniref:ribonuclease P protein component n=1 Tax=Niabella hibiscisoli TaxID=1825928 RepID=UPI001F0D096D|nr:ribonuclease P protein component [Niabella hibiscisoli]MCH5715454.1 ribonuclease P protein component [Niabella hibiscisoli]